MAKLELHKNHKLFLAITGLVLVGSAVASYFVWKECQQLEEEAIGMEEQVQVAKAKIMRIDDLEEQVIILRENVKEYVRILPSDAEFTELFKQLSDFASSIGIRLSNLNPKQERRQARSTKAFEQVSYSLKFEATYFQTLQFINRLENYERFVSFASIKVRAGNYDPLEHAPDFQPLHSCDVQLVTYVYVGGAESSREVQIAGYDRKRAFLAEQIAEARHDLHLEKFQLLAEGVRRDPMVDPRRRVEEGGGSGGDEGAIDAQRALIAEARDIVAQCDALFGMMKDAASVMREMELRVEGWNALTELQAKLDVVMAKNEISDPKVKREFETAILPEVARLRKQFGSEDMGGEDRDRIRIKKTLEQMREAFRTHDYEAVARAYEVISMVVNNATDPELVACQSEMEQLYLNATTAVAFEQVKIDVSGLVVYPDSADSVAIINGVVYREGEAITDEMFLVDIGEDHLLFEFRGVLLTYDL